MDKHSLPVTALIAARNEEANLQRCLAALEPAEQVVVVDSRSTDGTAAIATRHGAEVVQFDYRGGYPKKRQWALDTLDFRTEWILLIDADEVVPDRLWEEIQRVVAAPHSNNAYLITKGFHFLGRRFRFGGFSHAAVLFFRRGTARFEQLVDDSADGLDMEVHERLIVDGGVGKLRTPLIHEDFKGLQAYFDRHNRYSTWESLLRYRFLQSARYGNESIAPRFFGNTQERRRFLKRVAVRAPAEPLFWFLYHYFVRLGFLEGRPGFIASRIRSDYVAQVRAKIYELGLSRNGRSRAARLEQRRQRDAPPAPTLLIVSQVYVPDPAAVGQHFHDAAAELARRGIRVRVLTSRDGYEDPKQWYARREVRDGVEIRRLCWSSFGKRSVLLRLLGAASFLLQVFFRAVFMRHVDGLLVSTSPPMGPLAALAIAAVRRLPIVYWAMDINPDQAVALGRFRAHSKPVRWMDRLNRTILRRARKVITLDRFMAERLQRKQDCGPRLAVIPPWPLDDGFQPIDHQHNSFRHQHGLEHKFVAMYSGNMSIAHPLRTLLHAARRLRDCTDLVFLFVGGGLGRKEVERFVAEDDAGNIRILPYQPREQLRYSLSAADIHLVSMGDDMVGIVHPCKIYGAMACGRPVLFVGPRVSHAAELIAKHRIGWQVEHGDVDGVVAAVREAMNAPETMLAEMGCRARTAICRHLSRSSMRKAVCDEIEAALAPACVFTAPSDSRAIPAWPPPIEHTQEAKIFR